MSKSFIESSSPGRRFDALIHRDFWIISKITIGNLCKLFYDIISLFSPTSNFRYRGCLKQGVPWHSCNYKRGFTLKRIHNMIRTSFLRVKYEKLVEKTSNAEE